MPGLTTYMKQFDPDQIAAELTGKPFSAWPELRLLMLFQSQAGNEVEAEVGTKAIRPSLPKAA
jgi:hypothetical protein